MISNHTMMLDEALQDKLNQNETVELILTDVFEALETKGYKNLRNFIEKYKNLFENISFELHSREKTPINDVFQSIMIYSYKIIIDHIKSSNDVISKQLLNNFRSGTIKIYNKR